MVNGLATGNQPMTVPAPRGLLSSIWIVFRLAGLRPLAGRRGVLLGLVVSIPPVLAAVSAFGGIGPFAGANGFVRAMAHATHQVIQPIVLLFLCCAALGEEIEGKTVVYLLTRPVARSAIVLGRFLSAVAASLMLLVPSVVLTYVFALNSDEVAETTRSGAAFDRPLLGDMLLVVLLGVVLYGALYLLLSVAVRRPVITGLALGILEGVLPTVPGDTALLSPKFHLAVIAYRLTGARQFVVTHLQRLDDLPNLGTSISVVVGLGAVCLGVAALIFQRREYVA